jgi:hypothetical protein
MCESLTLGTNHRQKAQTHVERVDSSFDGHFVQTRLGDKLMGQKSVFLIVLCLRYFLLLQALREKPLHIFEVVFVNDFIAGVDCGHRVYLHPRVS